MSSALRKLHKKKTNSTSIMALQKLNKQPNVARQPTDHIVSSELIEIAKQSGLEILNEVKKEVLSETRKPFNPILSWFDEAQVINVVSNPQQTQSAMQSKVQTSNKASSPQQLASLPLKSPPCKKCPALRNGLCKCALKRFK